MVEWYAGSNHISVCQASPLQDRNLTLSVTSALHREEETKQRLDLGLSFIIILKNWNHFEVICGVEPPTNAAVHHLNV